MLNGVDPGLLRQRPLLIRNPSLGGSKRERPQGALGMRLHILGMAFLELRGGVVELGSALVDTSRAFVNAGGLSMVIRSVADGERAYLRRVGADRADRLARARPPSPIALRRIDQSRDSRSPQGHGQTRRGLIRLPRHVDR